MAHLTLQTPDLVGGVTTYVAYNLTYALEKIMPYTVTILDVRIFALSAIRKAWGLDAHEVLDRTFAVVLHPGEDQRIADLLPPGYEITYMRHTDGVERPHLHVNPDYLYGQWERQRYAYAEAYKSPFVNNSHWHHPLDYLTDAHISRRELLLTARMATRNVRDKLIQVLFDLQSPDDLSAWLDVRALDTTVETSLRTLRIWNSAFKKMPSVPIAAYAGGASVAGYVGALMRADKSNITGTYTCDAFDQHLLPGAMVLAERALSVNVKEKATTARGIWVEDDPQIFPTATRCNDLAGNWLVFSINAKRGSYWPATNDWQDRDFMLIHRMGNKWRFLFGCYFEVQATFFSKVRMCMITPYTVEDSECTAVPNYISPQRGMPSAITTAIHETPYCAAAISHGLARLKYVRSQVPAFEHLQTARHADLHKPKLGVLFRNIGRDKRRLLSPRRGKATRDFRDKGNDLIAETVGHLVEALPPSKVDFEDKVYDPMKIILGAAERRPRALVLDM